MAFFLPSFFQKRILRYALSRLNLLDTDDWDLDKLDIAWGKRSTVELREVGIKLNHLAALLKLPTYLTLIKAKILLLRITVPADIYSSGILVEVEGVEGQVHVSSEAQDKTRAADARSRAAKKGGIAKGIKANRPRSTQPLVHDPGGVPNESGSRYGDNVDEGTEHLPSTKDLAQSFLQTEPASERAQLRAAVAKSQNLLQSQLSEQDDEDDNSGLGVGLSLPAFVADFLKGVGDRLVLKIKNVKLDVDIKMDFPSFGSSATVATATSENLTFRISIGAIEIDEAATVGRSSVQGDIGSGLGHAHMTLSRDPRQYRQISLKNIRGMVLSDASLFAHLSHFSGPPSPTVTHSSHSNREGGKRARDLYVGKSSSSSSSAGLEMTQATILDENVREAKAPSKLDASIATIATSDGERFADARVNGEIEDFSNASKSYYSQYQAPREQNFRQNQGEREGHLLEDSDTLPSEMGSMRKRKIESKAEYDGDLLGTSVPNFDEDILENEEHFNDDGEIFESLPPSPNDHSRKKSGKSQSSSLMDHHLHLSAGSRQYSSEIFEEALTQTRSSSNTGSQETSPDEDLSKSKIFSSEEGHSLYMSAISHTSTTQSRKNPLPGGWDENDFSEEESLDTVNEKSTPSPKLPASPSVIPNRSVFSSTDEEHLSNYQDLLSNQITDPIEWTLSHTEERVIDKGATAVRTPAMNSSKTKSEGIHPKQYLESSGIPNNPARMIKDFIAVDNITIQILQGQDETSQQSFNEKRAVDRNENTYSAPDTSSMFDGQDASTEFSRPRKTSITRRQGAENSRSIETQPPATPPLSLVINGVSLLSEMSLIKLMVFTAQQISSIQSFPIESEKIISTASQSSLLYFSIRLHQLSWKFVDVIRGYVETDGESSTEAVRQPLGSDSDVLLVATAEELELVYKSHANFTMDLSVGRFVFGYPSDDIISFNSALKMRESTRDILTPTDKDIVVNIVQTPNLLKIDANTRPLHIRLDLARLDETFGWLGGLSTVLGLGNSMMSTVTVIDVRPKPSPKTKSARGVRFETPRQASSTREPETTIPQKATIRIGGLVFDLLGKESSLRLKGTAMRLVSRAEGIGMQIDHLKFSGPHLKPPGRDPAISADLSNIRLEYLSTPKEVDLARLLALLSPSRDRDEEDDDILMETLLRQRRQGGVMRLTVGTVEGKVSSLHDLSHFSAVSEELAKLSTVTKYLPEDDRPGILTLLLIRDLDLDVQVNKNIGCVNIALNNLEIAHVTLPSLILLGVSNLQIRKDDQELVGEAIPSDPEAEQQSPMIMVRLIGDEMEPTIKFKLWNMRMEYHVSLVMAVMGLSETASGEVVVSDMVNSIATLTDRKSTAKLASQTSSSSERSSYGSKSLRFEISVRDSIVGLNPRDSVSKALVVLTNTKVEGTFPKNDESDLQGSLGIKKASLMIIDDTGNLIHAKETGSAITGVVSQVQRLAAMGYVPLSEISAANIKLQMISSGNGDERIVDVEIRDNLFVLESCADSTNTLQSIFGGLSPPMPPSTELKYRTEVVPVEDMLASFSGDAFNTTGERSREDDASLFGPDDGDMMDDEVPQNLEFVSSFYNPDDISSAESIVNSMLESDLGSLASLPITRDIGDKRMLQSFQEQFEVSPGGESLEINEDHFSATSTVGGTAHRWNTDRNTYDLANESKIQGSPFRLRVRNVHVIWNLFDGYDWQRTRDTISQAVADVESKAADRLARRDRRRSPVQPEDEEDSVIGDFLFNSIYIGVPANRDPRDLSRQVNRNIDDLVSEAESYATTTTVSGSPSRQGQAPKTRRKKLRLQRSRHHKMTFELKGVSIDFVVFPPQTGETQSSIDIRVQDLDIFDHVPTSTWKKFATYMHDAGERESGTNMIHIEILNTKPVPDLAASEIILKATVLPLRLHVDQDALDFMSRFFEFKDDTAPTETTKSEATFLQRVEVNSIQVKLDFKPKRVDYAGLRSGHTNEFMNFFILDQADMVMRHVIIYGVSGFDKLGKTLNDIWMPDIKRNQLPGVLAGLAPVRSLVNVGGGVRDLVVIPMREYRKDGRIVRSIQKGAISFAKTTTTELARLGAKLAVGTQTVLQGAEDFLGPASPGDVQRLDSWEAAELDEEEKEQISLYADQPVGVMQGLRGAYRHLERDLIMAKDAIVAMPGEVMDSGSAGGAARAVMRGAPTIILRPALGVTKAVGQTLMGATNSLDKGERRRIEDKYKRH